MNIVPIRIQSWKKYLLHSKFTNYNKKNPAYGRRQLSQPMRIHPGKMRQYSTGAVWRANSSGLESFGNFGRFQYRIQEGGHLPYEG